jgi:hypothetical protein
LLDIDEGDYPGPDRIAQALGVDGELAEKPTDMKREVVARSRDAGVMV